MSRAVSWAERTVRGDEARLRNLRVLTEEVGLLLSELAEMDEKERLGAHGHQRQLRSVLDRMTDEVGPLGEDPARKQERIERMVRETMTPNGSSHDPS